MQIVQIKSFNELAILQSIKAAVGSVAKVRSRSTLTNGGSSPYTSCLCSTARFIKLSLEVFFNWCVLSEVGLRVDPSAFFCLLGPHRFTSPSFGALFEGNAGHLDISGSPSIASDFIGCKSSENESAATRQTSHSPVSPSPSLCSDKSHPAGRS